MVDRLKGREATLKIGDEEISISESEFREGVSKDATEAALQIAALDVRDKIVLISGAPDSMLSDGKTIDAISAEFRKSGATSVLFIGGKVDVIKVRTKDGEGYKVDFMKELQRI